MTGRIIVLLVLILVLDVGVRYLCLSVSTAVSDVRHMADALDRGHSQHMSLRRASPAVS